MRAKAVTLRTQNQAHTLYIAQTTITYCKKKKISRLDDYWSNPHNQIRVLTL